MINLQQFENFLGKGVNERLSTDSKNLILDIASRMGLDPEELLRRVQSNLEEEGMSESKINEWMGSDGLVTMAEFFTVFPAVVLGIISLAKTGSYLQGRIENNRENRLEVDRRLKNLIKQDPTLIDKKEELIARVVEEMKKERETSSKRRPPFNKR